MKIQNLAVLFIIIMLPISMVINTYVQNQVETLNWQIAYDTKLNNATYDALKAFQLNTINNDASDLTNSKLRDIEASANTFFNSIASNFNMAGYNQELLKDYVPALVYTMYDGYYIYSPYTNTLDKQKNNKVTSDSGETTMESDADILGRNPSATYKDKDIIHGIKPYIHYSCRYKPDASSDFIITYSLENYITIEGTINGKPVFDAGYLLDNVEIRGGKVYYRGVEILENDKTTEKIDPENEYEYIKLNGVKYYKDGDKWFSILSNSKYTQDNFDPKTTGAIEYYKEAYDFTQKIRGTSYIDSKRRSEK